jgi:3,8-divinyl chlorophyllide a/chlorophyllide a reductase subunit Z
VQLLDEYVEREPFLVRISAAKRLRDRVERDARLAREGRVTASRVAQSLAEMA